MFNVIIPSLSTAVIISIIFIFCLFKYPDSVDKFLSKIAWGLSFIFKRFEYNAIQKGIEGKINSFVEDLNKNTNIGFNKIKVKWANIDEEEKIFTEDYETLIIMKDREGRNKNFIHAVYFYTSEIFLSRAKRYLSLNQKKSIDMFTIKAIVENQSIEAMKEFMDNYFIPSIENEGIKKYIKKYDKIQEVGLFFPVLIQELTSLGNKALLSDINKKIIIEEVKGLIDFLDKFSRRTVGDNNTPEIFFGKITRCTIKIVATSLSVKNNNVASQAKRIISAIKIGCENIYIIGNAAKENREFIKRVVNLVLKEKQEIVEEKELIFKGVVNMNNVKNNVKTYFVYLHNFVDIKNII